MDFAILGVAGFVATRHLEAIKAVGGTVQAAIDPFDSVGRLDSYGLNVKYSKDVSILYDIPIDWLSVCTPNYLHHYHCTVGLVAGANVICEKPLVIDPSDLNVLKHKEEETGKKIYTVLQLRYHPLILQLKEQLVGYHNVKVEYHTPRGQWYQQSWKGNKRESGGLLFNIGIHLFDLLLWLFGPMHNYEINNQGSQTKFGTLHLERALVDWSLSISPNVAKKRELIIDGLRVDLTDNFDNLHAKVYQEAINGRGYGIDDAKGAIELCYLMSQ